MTSVPEREVEPVFCSECQNPVDVSKARMLDGLVLCPKDLAKRGLFDRIRARKLPENYRRRSGGTFRSLFTSIAALMLVVGIAFVWKAKAQPQAPAGGPAAESSPMETAEAAEDSPALLSAPGEYYLVSGISMMLAAVIVAISGTYAGDVLDLLLDISHELRHLRR